MAARKLNFLQAVATEYREKCPELSRIMMMKYFERLNGSNIEDHGESLQGTMGKTCEHCGTIFTDKNCTFSIKPKRKRKKRYVKYDNTLPRNYVMPKSSNFLQIHCHYCGWKTRQIGAIRDTRRSISDINGSLRNTYEDKGGRKQTFTPCKTRKLSASHSSTGLQHSSGKTSGNKKKTKSRLNELLAREKSESDQKMTSPSLINFLSTI